MQPENVKEVVVWKRYSELKKLHGELVYTHRNLFRRQEEFPPFPRAQVFGRFDEAVIEERRKAAESMLVFTTNIPALYNSPQLKEFFRGGEVRRPLDTSTIANSLPPPLIPLPERDTGLLAEEETGREAPIQAQELQSNQRLTDQAKLEMAVDVLSDTESSSTQETQKLELHKKENKTVGEIKAHQNYGTDESSAAEDITTQISGSPVNESEDFDLLFGSELDELTDTSLPVLLDTDLAIFDPCAKEEQQYASPSHAELLSVPQTSTNDTEPDRDATYESQANNELNAAEEREREADYSAAVQRYRAAVDILMKGVQGDVDLKRRNSVKRKIAEVLEHAERLLSIQTHNHNT